MKKDFLKELGVRISQKRKALGITQEDLAEKLDVSVQFISYIERGQKGVGLENLVKLSQLLNTSCDYLLTGERNESDNTELFERIKNLSAKEYNLIEMIVNYLN